jgi:hypothetical protein
MRTGQALGADFYRLFVLSDFIECAPGCHMHGRIFDLHEWRPDIFTGRVPVILARQRKAFIGELLCTCCVAGRRTPRGRESKRMAALVAE